MKVKTPLAAVAFAAIAGFAGMAFAASNTAPTTTNAPCAEQMRADYAELAQAMNLTGPAKPVSYTHLTLPTTSRV